MHGVTGLGLSCRGGVLYTLAAGRPERKKDSHLYLIIIIIMFLTCLILCLLPTCCTVQSITMIIVLTCKPAAVSNTLAARFV